MRRGIGWLGFLSDINQSKYRKLQKTSMECVIWANNGFLFFKFVLVET